MSTFQLFKIRAIKPPRKSLFHEYKEPPKEVINLCLQECPENEIRKGQVWHIGNISHIEPHAAIFKIGKTKTRATEKFDENLRQFIEADSPDGVSTYVVIDMELGAILIQEKATLAKTEVIAEGIGKLLEISEYAAIRDYKFIISPIYTPENLIKLIDNSIRITKLQFTFHPPNPFDTDEMHKSLEKVLEEIDAKKGEAEIEGEDLCKEKVSLPMPPSGRVENGRL